MKALTKIRKGITFLRPRPRSSRAAGREPGGACAALAGEQLQVLSNAPPTLDVDMEYAITRETHSDWIEQFRSSCSAAGASFRVVDMSRDDWMVHLRGCRGLFWRPRFDDRLAWLDARAKIPIAESMGLRCFPSSSMLWLYDDKVRQAWFFRDHGVPTPHTFVSRDREECLQFLKSAHFPLVFKAATGASSNGVYLVKGRAEAESIVRWVLGSRPSVSAGGLGRRLLHEVGRRLHLAGPQRNLTHAEVIIHGVNSVYFQEYVRDDGDWRITTFARDMVSVFRRLNRPGDFRASGSGRWKKPSLEELPRRACDYLLDLSRRHGFSCMAYDVFLRGDAFVIGEMSYTILLNDIYSRTLFRRAQDGSYTPADPIPITLMHLNALEQDRSIALFPSP